MASPENWWIARRRPSHFYRKCCRTTAVRCGGGSKKDLLQRGWPRIMSAFIVGLSKCGRPVARRRVARRVSSLSEALAALYLRP